MKSIGLGRMTFLLWALLGGCSALTDFAPETVGTGGAGGNGGNGNLDAGPAPSVDSSMDAPMSIDAPRDQGGPGVDAAPDAPPPPPPPECQADWQCNDLNACTVDACFRGSCVHRAQDCSDGIDCTIDGCNPLIGCTHQPNAGRCDDNVPCTSDQCDAVAGCVHSPDNARCSDGDACTQDACVSDGAGTRCEHSREQNCVSCQKDDECPMDYCQSCAVGLAECRFHCQSGRCQADCGICKFKCKMKGDEKDPKAD